MFLWCSLLISSLWSLPLYLVFKVLLSFRFFIFLSLEFICWETGSSSFCCVICFLPSIVMKTHFDAAGLWLWGRLVALVSWYVYKTYITHDLVWYSLIKWHPLLVKKRPSSILLHSSWIENVIQGHAGLYCITFFFFIDFQHNALSSPWNALVPFYYMLMLLLNASLTTQCNGSMSVTKCFNLALIRCHIHSNSQEGELLESWSADCWVAPVEQLEVKCLAQGQLKCLFHSQRADFPRWVADWNLTSLLL